MIAAELEGGFADSVLGAQETFRALMDALAQPGTIQPLRPPRTHSAMPARLAEVALTLCDHDTPIWLDASLAMDRGVADWLRFHTGARLATEPSLAAFAFISDVAQMPVFAAFEQGTDEYPDRSTTLVVALPALVGGAKAALKGPGIDSTREISPRGLPADFVSQWADNRTRFPRGVDLLLVSGNAIMGLPRSARIMGED